LGELWETEDTGKEEDWNELVRTRIHEREEEEWKKSILESTKLRTYVTLKRKLEREPYLEIRNRWGVVELTKIRGGTNRLRIEKGRYQKLPEEERICEFCEKKEVEDETHFILKCPLYTDLREEMWKSVEEITGTGKEEWEEKERLNVLIGDKLSTRKRPDGLSESEKKVWKEDQKKLQLGMSKVVIKYICRAMIRRRTREGAFSEKFGLRAPLLGAPTG
jgi:hypothetical protein